MISTIHNDPETKNCNSEIKLYGRPEHNVLFWDLFVWCNLSPMTKLITTIIQYDLFSCKNRGTKWIYPYVEVQR